MRTVSWSERARQNFNRLWETYQNEPEEAKPAYKKYIFEVILNPYQSTEYGLEYVGYWRAPLIQQRIAKMWNRAEKRG